MALVCKGVLGEVGSEVGWSIRCADTCFEDGGAHHSALGARRDALGVFSCFHQAFRGGVLAARSSSSPLFSPAMHYDYASGSTSVIFEGCTVTDNFAVSMRQRITRRCMRASGSVQITAMARSCLERAVLRWVRES